MNLRAVDAASGAGTTADPVCMTAAQYKATVAVGLKLAGEGRAVAASRRLRPVALSICAVSIKSGANRWLVRLRDSGRGHPNPVFQQSYPFDCDGTSYPRSSIRRDVSCPPSRA